jgi:class 3 adenylate cyclase
MKLVALRERVAKARDAITVNHSPRFTRARADAAAPDRAHREVTLLAVDLVDSTPLVERLDAGAFERLLDVYLDEMTSLAHAHRGTVCSVAGDGLLVVFGAPERLPAEEQVRAAVDAALVMRARVRALGLDGGAGELALRIGVNTGVCAVGTFGSDAQRTYTAIGRPVHVASRLERAATPGEILLGPRTAELLGFGPALCHRGELVLKGFDSPVVAHAVVLP